MSLVAALRRETRSDRNHVDINNQGSDQQELYFYMNSGHEQTEAYRTGLFGPYAMVFTTGSTPSGTLDTTFMDSLGLKGYVASSGRGKVTGSYSGVLSGPAVTIGFANSAAQYWASGSGSELLSSMHKHATNALTGLDRAHSRRLL